MTPEQAARFVRSDCRDPALRQIADRECEAALAQALTDPIFKAKWEANLAQFANEIDERIVNECYLQIKGC